MSDIFVSYARSDHAFVAELVAALTERGPKEVWVDLERIPPTAEWLAEINQAIESSDNALFVLSPAFLTSEICAMELTHAVKCGKRLIPVVREDVDSDSVPTPLRERNWIFCREQDNFQDAVTRTFEAIELDLDWLKLHTRILVQANEWRQADDDKSRLLSGRALTEAEAWLSEESGHDPKPTDVQREFISVSRRHAIAKRRVMVSISIAVAAIAVLLTLWGFQERRQTARRTEVALARNLIVKANAQPKHRPELRAHLAIEAVRRLEALDESTHDAVKALRKARSFLLPVGKMLYQNAPIKAIRFSSEGAHIATLDSDNAVRLWSTKDWTPTGPFKAPRPIQTFAIDSNGRAIGGAVEAFDDIEARLYDLTRGIEIAALTHPGETKPPRSTVNIPLHSVLSIALLGDAKRVITGGVSSVRLWSITDGSQLQRVIGGTFAIGPIIIGVDESHASVKMLHEDRYVYSLESGKRITKTRERILAIGVKGDHLLRGEGTNAKLIARKDGLVAQISHEGQINVASFSADGKWVATGAEDGSTGIWHVSDGRPMARIRHDAPVTGVAFNPDASLIALGGPNGRLQIRPAGDAREPLPLSHQSAIRSLAFSPDGLYNASGTEDGEIKVWSLISGQLLANFNQTHAVRKLAFSVDGDLLVSLDIDATHMWRFKTKDDRRSFKHRSDGSSGYKAMPWTLDFSSNGRYLAVGGSFNHTLLLDLKHRKKRRLKVTGSVVALRFLRKSHHLAAASKLKVSFLDLERRETLHVFPNEHPIAAMEIGGEDRWLAVADRKQNLKVWDIAKKAVVVDQLIAFVPTVLAFSHDAMHLAVRGDDTPLIVFNMPAGDVVFQVNSPDGGKVKATAFSNAGPYLASAGSDQIVRIWSAENGEELERLERDGDQTSLAFSPDGRHLLIGGTDRMVHRWLWRRHDLISETCARLSTPAIAQDEWREFLGATPYRETCQAGS